MDPNVVALGDEHHLIRTTWVGQAGVISLHVGYLLQLACLQQWEKVSSDPVHAQDIDLNTFCEIVPECENQQLCIGWKLECLTSTLRHPGHTGRFRHCSPERPGPYHPGLSLPRERPS